MLSSGFRKYYPASMVWALVSVVCILCLLASARLSDSLCASASSEAIALDSVSAAADHSSGADASIPTDASRYDSSHPQTPAYRNSVQNFGYNFAAAKRTTMQLSRVVADDISLCHSNLSKYYHYLTHGFQLRCEELHSGADLLHFFRVLIV